MVVALNIYRCGSGGRGGPMYVCVLKRHTNENTVYSVKSLHVN